jgi:glycosyltransferase involved in cell wall biosynthesis
VNAVTLGLDTTRFHPPASEVASNERHELLIFGRFDPIKGHESFFRLYARALPLLGPRAPRLHVAGEPANISAIQLIRAAEAAGLTDGKDFRLSAGRIPEVAQLMGQAIAGVIPSLGSELICRVAEEFLLCGTPIAVSGVGSLGEMLFPGAGLNLEGASDEAAAEALSAFIDSARHEDTASRNTRATRAKDLFSLETMGRSLDDLIAAT